MSQATIVFFGDSICEGYRAAKGGGWVERLSRLLPQTLCVNSGVSGETSKDALRRFDASVAVHQPQIVYIQFGLNDASWWCRQVGKPWLTEDAYIANMQTIASRSALCGASRILVATNHPVANATPCAPAKPSYGQMVTQYNAALRAAFSNEGVTLIDMERAILDSGLPHTDFLDPDGVHLNATGNQFYAQTVSTALQPLLQL